MTRSSRSPSTASASISTGKDMTTSGGGAEAAEHAIEREQDDDALLDLRHRADARGVDPAAEVRRFLDVALGNVQHVRHRVDDDAAEGLPGLSAHLDDDDAGAFGVGLAGEAE